MRVLVFEFYLQILGGKVVKDITDLRVDPQLAKMIVENQVQVNLMFSKNSTSPTIRLRGYAGHHQEFFQRTSAFCQVKRSSENTNCT
jgi:hypothetical protein